MKFCHIPAFNGDSKSPHFSFTPHSYFTADTAHRTCKEVGGKVPELSKEYDIFMLIRAIEYLSSFVRLARPYSLRWSSWPVSKMFIIHKFDLYCPIVEFSIYILTHMILLQFLWLNGERFDRFSKESKINPIYK